MSEYKVKIQWKSNKQYDYDHYNRNHTIEFSGPQKINNSSAPEYLGDASCANPEELLGSALGSCHMLTFLAVASKSGYKVESYDDIPTAILDKNSEGKLAVTKIILNPKIIFEGDNQPDHEKIKSMHEKAHRNCFIANSIKCIVEII